MMEPLDPIDFDLNELPATEHENQLGKKRYKTTGDSPEPPRDRAKRQKSHAPPLSSSFHTQTLTQFVRDRTFTIQDSDDEGFELMLMCSPGEKRKEELPEPTSANRSMVRTPSKRPIKTEIPPSTHSVFSPMLDRYSPPNQRSSPSELRSRRKLAKSGPGPKDYRTPEVRNVKDEIPPSNESAGSFLANIHSEEEYENGPESPLIGRSTTVNQKGQGESDAPRTPNHNRSQGDMQPSLHSGASALLNRYRSLRSRRQIVKEKSANMSLTTSTSATKSKRPIDIMMEDAFSPRRSRGVNLMIRKTPGRHTPMKRARFMLPGKDREAVPDEETQESIIVISEEEGDDSCPESPSPKPRPRRESLPRNEVPDSDNELGWGNILHQQTPRVAKKTPVVEVDSALVRNERKEDSLENLENNKRIEEDYGDIGDETQAFVNAALSSAERSGTGAADSLSPRSSDFKSGAPIPKRQARTRRGSTDTKRQSSSLRPEFQPTRRLKPKPVIGTQLESQRLPIDLVRQMAPNQQYSNADIFISMHPQHVDRIVDSTKNHEFRNYRFPETVSRLWIYTTKPVGELRYMAHIKSAKKPGEIAGERGLGNVDFNAGKGAKFAFEIIQVYELNNPVALDEMKAEGWISAPPQKYKFVPPAVLGQLIGNLRCELFEEGELFDEDEELLDMSQLVEAQIRNDVEHSKQLAPEKTTAPEREQEAEEVVPSSHKSDHEPAEVTPRPVRLEVRLAQDPRGVEDEDEVIEETPRPNERRLTMRPSQASTESQASSPTQSPNKSVHRSATLSSLPLSEDIEQSPIWMQLGQCSYDGSSELLSTSQMLPESLLMDMGPEIRDSEEGSDKGSL